MTDSKKGDNSVECRNSEDVRDEGESTEKARNTVETSSTKPADDSYSGEKLNGLVRNGGEMNCRGMEKNGITK